MDYFSKVERQLSTAVRVGAHRPRYARIPFGRPGTRRPPRPLAVLLACLVMGGTALAASGVIHLGSPVHVRANSPHVGGGVPAPGGSRLLPIAFPDPAGGPPWGLRAVRTTRGLVCLQVGRVLDGKLGVLGIDGAFHGDGQLHPLPATALPGSVPGIGPGLGHGEEAACHLPGEAFSQERNGIERSASGANGANGGAPRSRLRDIYFGALGPQALSVSYLIGGHSGTQRVVPGVGAYLLVTAVGAADELGTSGGTMSPAGSVAPVKPLTAIAYRVGGRECRRLLPGQSATDQCPESQALYPPSTFLPPNRDLHVPLHVTLQRAGREVTAARVGFRAPYPVSGAAQSYELQIPLGPCHGGLGGAVGSSTNSDIATGSQVQKTIGSPFSNLCSGERAVTIEVVYRSAGRRAVKVGEIRLAQPQQGR